MSYLQFISDDDLVKTLTPIVNSITALNKGAADLSRNRLDPFAALFECVAGDLDHASWKKSERARQAQKTITNKIGDFHEAVIGSLKGCTLVPKGKGLDILNENDGWCAEVKNKFNTTKGNHKPRLYDDIEKWVNHYTAKYRKQFTGYYVQIIPSKSQDLDKPFTPPDAGVRRPNNAYIREISGALLYTKITGDDDALKKLYKALPIVLKEKFNMNVQLKDAQLERLFLNNIKN